MPRFFRCCDCVMLCNRRLADEDDELSEVQPDAVPPEVREWLASTFTRQLVTTRKRTEEKPKFRTVAHAIRAGIFVDRIYRRVSSTAMLQFPPEVVKVLKVNINRKSTQRLTNCNLIAFPSSNFVFSLFFRFLLLFSSSHVFALR